MENSRKKKKKETNKWAQQRSNFLAFVSINAAVDLRCTFFSFHCEWFVDGLRVHFVNKLMENTYVTIIILFKKKTTGNADIHYDNYVEYVCRNYVWAFIVTSIIDGVFATFPNTFTILLVLSAAPLERCRFLSSRRSNASLRRIQKNFIVLMSRCRLGESTTE